MNPNPAIRQGGCVRRRGMGYAAVLAITMVVTVVGLAGLLAARIELRGSRFDADATRADVAARGGLELVVHRLQNNPAWRARYTHDTWTASEQALGYILSFKLQDATDASLSDDVYDPVRVYVRCTVGSATRIYSALLVPDGKQELNLLTNGNIEKGTTGWTSRGMGTLSATTSSPQEGAYCLRSSGDLISATGIFQDVTAQLQNNTTYYTEVWVRSQSLSATKTALLVIQTTKGTKTVSFNASWTDSTWQKMSGTFQTAWTGELISAYWGVQSSLLFLLGGDLRIDDARLIWGNSASGSPTLRVQRGSIRREVLP